MKAILFLLAISHTLPAAPEAAWTEWQWVAPVEIKRAGMIRLELPPAVLDASRPDLGDLRVLSPTGGESPYFLMDHPTARDGGARDGLEFKTFLSGRATVVEVSSGTTADLEAVELVTPAREFLKSVSIEGMSGGNWRRLSGNEVVFRQSGGAQRLRIPVPAAAWEGFRFTVDDDRSQPVPFTGVRVFPATRKAETVDLPATLVKREEFPGETRLTIDLGARNLDVADCRLEIADAVFSRTCKLEVFPTATDGANRMERIASGTIYRVVGENGISADHLEVSIQRRVPGRYLLVTIPNGDSPPLTVSSATLRCHPTILAFHAASAGAWQLLTGRRSGKLPEYDLAPLRGALTDAGGARLMPGPLQENPDHIPPPVLPGVETGGSSIDLTDWSRRRKVEAPSPGVIRIELDAGILAASRSDLGDVRLVQDGRQIPYLIKQGTRIRELKPSGFVRKDDPKRPNVSRWEITLPVTGLPVVSLGARSTAGLFERRFVATTERKDSLGNAWTEELGSADWTKTGNAESSLLLNLRGSRLPATFFLETDHGDNPPIPVDNPVIRYAAPSITAKLAGGAAAFLCYGNPQAARPQYDLRLVRDELMAAEQQTATLGDEELLRPGAKGPLAMDAGSPWLWVALAGVVAVLLMVVAKLLPRETQPGTGV